MTIRKKGRLEKLFSFNQYRKRLGAHKVSQQLDKVDYSTLKETIIENSKKSYTHGANKNLSYHLDNLRAEFSGESELLYYHAKLIVLIRREYKVEANFDKINNIWLEESDFLLEKLNTRWLMSAADTFADCSKDPLEKSLALSASLLINTIKLQETENFIQQSKSNEYDPKKIEVLQSNRVGLFDGTSAFTIGTDDTLRNMRWRLDSACKENKITGKILLEIFQRVQEYDTVYYRFKQKHTRHKTSWW